MADVLIARTPLASAGELSSHGVAAAVALSEMPFAAMIDVRLDPADRAALNAVQQAIGFDMPLVPNKSSAAGERTAWWLGPDQWLVVVPPAEAPALLRALESAAPSVVDVSDLRARFELAGPRAADVLRKGCGVDLHPRVFRPGDCALTVLGRVRVGIMQIDGRPAYRILVERSVAPYLWDWLADAMREFTGS